MPERRETQIVEDPISGDIALQSRARGRRPNEFRQWDNVDCPFCPGAESQTPQEIASIVDGSGAWLARAFLNKYPAVTPPDGDHELIVDSTAHDDELTRAGVGLWRERLRAALGRFPKAMPVLFKNSGEFAGATIRHPHTQLITLARPIPRWERLRARALAHWERSAGCVWCEDARQAPSEGRSVETLGLIAAYVPSRSRYPSLLRFIPLRCAASFSEASDAELDDFTALARRAIRGLDGLAFNLFFEGDPNGPPGASHWHADLVPRESTFAGFELASGLHITTGAPEESAELWRRMMA